ncbi:MAG: dihydrodipicolinate synthase family protein [Planctomycetes bacterium]|nr:dihydrodipicolinate synthase family protein [Planctomycetota bacterium]
MHNLWPLHDLVRPRRAIVGMSAVLLPLDHNKSVDWPAFERHVKRTVAAGLIPAVNMDTGFTALLDHATRQEVLHRTENLLEGRPFLAGAYVGDRPGAPLDFDRYRSGIEQIRNAQGTPIVFPSFGLAALPPQEVILFFERLGREFPKFYAFELGEMFHPSGRIWDLDTFSEIVKIPQCAGLKHSSLNRVLEWQRLRIRDRIRPEFQLLTGNDLAIDMVIYGSDYLLGLSTFAPDLFGLRDQLWREGAPEFYALNDWLQYLGMFAFRAPVPAYRHSAAQFLKLRGMIDCDFTYPGSPERPDSDRDILRGILAGLAPFLQ